MTGQPTGEGAAFDWDALSDQQRGAFDALANQAHDWACCHVTLDHVLAREFALWFAERHYAAGSPDPTQADFERWRAQAYAERFTS